MKSLYVASLYYFLVFNLSTAADTLASSQSLVSPDTMVSSDESFELGIFSKNNSTAWYLGIWYKNFPDIVVWVANRENPLADSNGAMTLSKNGTLVLSDRMNVTVWSSGPSTEAEDPVAQLLESGNLVVKAATNSESYIWQSFDLPSDTLLPAMRLLLNFKSGSKQFLTSWKNAGDPSLGLYTYKIENSVLPQLVLAQGSKKIFRSGPWNGFRLTGSPGASNDILKPSYIYDTNELYYIYTDINNSVITRSKLTDTGEVQKLVLNKGSTEWAELYTLPYDRCDNYGECGTNGICQVDTTPICKCLQGFVPKSQQEWEVNNRSSGCKRVTPLDCQKGEGFKKLKNIKLPDLLEFSVNNSMSIKKCRAECLKNCSCVAYAKSNISAGAIGCLMWFGELMDMRELIDEVSDQDLFIRMPASELGNSSQKLKRVVLILVISAAVVLLLLALSCWCIFLKKRAKLKGSGSGKEDKDIELPLVDFHRIEIGTNYFSWKNKLGEGGFGPVYKANLRPDELVAVKRLSRGSGQGLQEFRNEVTMIAKLQHRNLVKLLGCCIEGEERMLIYEYMANKSLDSFIFDQNRKNLLNWQKRFDIIIGIARGLLYLHQDSRLRIIHRDLKISNILLDHELTPKISDFGIARIFEQNQTEGKTKRVIGTYGYMSPEYAIYGKFSVKSDVFSFGVLLLEIVSGSKNAGFNHPDHYHSLLGHAWLLWNENKALELVDQCLEYSHYMEYEVLRSIQVGLLCVQKLPNDRPDMSSAVFMLCNESATLPEPKEPGFFTERSGADNESSTGHRSQTGLTITGSTLEAR